MKLGKFFIGVALISNASLASNNFPNHCNVNEQLVFSAKMQKVNRKTNDGSLYRLEPTLNVLSFCLKNSTLYYRYGKVGKVGLEHIATSTKPLNFSHKQIGNISKNNYSFQRGKYHYAISESGGMASGYGIKVSHNNKVIAELFSGNDEGVDFYKNSIDIPNQLLKSTD